MTYRLKQITSLLLVLFILYCIYLSSMYVMHGEVHLSNDIGRYFLLLRELDEKKIVLIGPRTNVQGAFHGVLWTYLNYPAYLLGGGDPVTVAWFWVGLGIIYLITSYLIFEKLFGRMTALLGTAALSPTVALLSNSLFGQLMNFYLMPFFIYTIFRYKEKKRITYLVLHLLILGCVVQFNIGSGALMTFLSITLLLVFILKNKLYTHLPFLLVLPVMLINFVLFDIRHDFTMTKALMGLGRKSEFIIPINEWITNRINHMISFENYSNLSIFIILTIFIIVILLTIITIHNNKKNSLIAIIIFYYFGYLLLSFFNKGIILIDHIVHLTPIAIMWMLYLKNSTNKYTITAFLLLSIYINFNSVKGLANLRGQELNGTSPDSWISLKEVGNEVITSGKNKTFGFYVYSPDSFAYQQRYAMLYLFNKAGVEALEYSKQKSTFIIIAPPPADNPYMTHQWWIKNKVRINSPPIRVKMFTSGYKIEEYNLSNKERTIPHVTDIELGIHFR